MEHRHRHQPWSAAILMLSLVGWATASPAAQADLQQARLATQPNTIIFKLKPGVSGLPTFQQRLATQGGIRAMSRGGTGLSNYALNRLGQLGLAVDKTYHWLGISQATVTGDTNQAVEALLRSGLVEYAEPVYRVKAYATQPNDPDFGKQWALNNGDNDHDIDAPEAWASHGTDASSTVVGIVDTGVDYTHPDLAANMWVNPQETAGDGIDNDDNGYIDDIHGIDAVNDDGDPMDDHAHGTHCAGIVGAVGNNKKGIAGVAWKGKIMALKFLDGYGGGGLDDAIETINYTVNTMKANGYKRMVLNNSWGGPQYSRALLDAIKMAEAYNVLYVAAAGNSTVDLDTTRDYPSGFASGNVVSVAASNNLGNLAEYSNYGCAAVDLVAPGSDVFSTVPGRGYDFMSGTSMASPMVAGMAALLWSKYPDAPWSTIKGLLMNGTEPRSSFVTRAVTQGHANLPKAFAQLGKPAIFSVSPNNLEPGAAVTVEGINFGAAKGKLIFKGIELQVQSWSSTKVVANAPALPYGLGKLELTTSTGSSSPVGACAQVSKGMTKVGEVLIARTAAAEAQIGNHVWVFGGEASWGVTGNVERISLSNNPIASSQSNWNMPYPVAQASAAALGNKVYVVGGLSADYGFQYANHLQIFDTRTQQWTQGAPLPVSLIRTTAVALEGKLVVFGGQNKNNLTQNSTYVYDPATNQWVKQADMPRKRAWAKALATTEGKAWVLGGLNTLMTPMAANDEYNLSSNTWAKRPAMNNLRAALGGANVAGQLVVASGDGTGLANGETNQLSGNWLQMLTTPQLSAPNAGQKSGYFYLLNGYNYTNQSLSNTIYRVKPQ